VDSEVEVDLEFDFEDQPKKKGRRCCRNVIQIMKLNIPSLQSPVWTIHTLTVLFADVIFDVGHGRNGNVEKHRRTAKHCR